MIASQQKSAQKPAANGRGSRWTVVVAVAGLALAVGIVTCRLLRPNENGAPEVAQKRPAQIATVQPDLPSAPEELPTTERKNPSKMYEGDVEVVKYAVSTNNSGAVIEKLTLADGRKISKVHPPKPVFDNPADQVIALAVSAKPGESMPPLPDLSGIDDDFAKSLLAPIKINDDDSDEIKELKAKVIETKAYLVDDIKNGGTVLEALKAHQEEMERIADSRLMAIREMQKLQAEGDAEMVRDFAERVNEAFRARGIPEILVPKK